MAQQYDKSFEEYQDWRNSQQSPIKKIVKNIEVKHVIWIIILAAIMLVIIQTQKEVNKNLIYILGGGLLAFVIFLTLKTTTVKKLITEEQAKIIVEEALKAKIGHEEWIPNGTQINLTGYCALLKWGDDYYKWEIGVQLIKPDGLIDERMIVVHPYEGFIMRIKATPTGYDATDAPDIKPVYAFEYYSPKNIPASIEQG